MISSITVLTPVATKSIRHRASHRVTKRPPRPDAIGTSPTTSTRLPNNIDGNEGDSPGSETGGVNGKVETMAPASMVAIARARVESRIFPVSFTRVPPQIAFEPAGPTADARG